MRRVITWCVANSRAMNIIVFAVLILGAMSLSSLRRETFPAFKLEIVLISVPYPGASPSEIEDGICRKIEEAVATIDGLKKVTSVSREGTGSVVCELHSHVRDVQKVLNEVESAVDRITTFPEMSERPQVQQVTFREPAIRIAVLGGSRMDQNMEWDLREVAERIREDLLQLPTVSNVNLSGRDYQIDVEIPEETLRKYNLTLSQVGDVIRQRNTEMPAGSIKTENTDYLMRGKNKLIHGQEISRIPVLTTADGASLSVGDLGVVKDGFVDKDSESLVNGKPAIVLTVQKSESEDVIRICQQVREYAKNKKMPEGYELVLWGDTSRMVEERLQMLGTNSLQGLAIVFVLLSLFLEIRLAFWVALGIPISILGACGVMLFADQTLNMISMFAFLMVLGIVVDDAIVVGENIYSHRQRGKSSVRAAIDGVVEVAPSIAASVATTIVCFMPMFFVSGVMGKFIRVMPLAIIAALAISLLEATLVFPCHLSHLKPKISTPWIFRVTGRILFGRRGSEAVGTFLLDTLGLRSIGLGWERLTGAVDRGLQNFLDRRYVPSLRFVLRYPLLAYSATLFFLFGTWGLVLGGKAPFVVFPKVDSDFLQVSIEYPTGTPGEVTRKAVKQLEDAARKANEEIKRKTGKEVVTLSFRSLGTAENPSRPEQLAGNHVGQVFLELLPAQDRRGVATSDQFLQLWREYAGEFPGIEKAPAFGTVMVGPSDRPIEFKLLSSDIKRLEEAVELTKRKLATYQGVFDISDDANPGSWEITLKIRPEAQSLGLTEAQLYQTIRANYYGEEVKRLQRGRNEVKLMVRYPEEDRKKLESLEGLYVRTPKGAEIPLSELADITVERGYAEINRVDQIRSVTITADVDEGRANAREIVNSLETTFVPELQKQFPDLRVRWEGQRQQTDESIGSMKWGYLVALAVNFVLLTIEFRSYTQAIIIFFNIPLGTAGAVLGHLLWGMPLTMFSVFGMVALAGIVVNDSIVMVDWINKLIHEKVPLKEALLRSGRERFRPIMLTSITTIGGLAPILFESSFQAQILIPMALTISFGLMTTTVWTLYLTPLMYQSWYHLTRGEHLDEFDEQVDEFVHEEEEESPAGHGPTGHRHRSIRRLAAGGARIRRRIHRPDAEPS